MVAGGPPGAWTRTLLERRRLPEWEDDGPETAHTVAAAPESEGVRRVRTAGDGRWAPRRGEKVVAGGEGSLLVVVPAGRGRIALLADSSPLQNRLLGEADNAAMALALSGRGPLTFVESVHGYGPARGLAALPARFGWALIGLALAALVFMFARGRRLGPPEPERRDLPPPRRAYVDALAATMARGRDREEAVAPVRAEARRRLARRAGLGTAAGQGAWHDAALAAGLEEREAQALSGRAADDETVVDGPGARARAERHPAHRDPARTPVTRCGATPRGRTMRELHDAVAGEVAKVVVASARRSRRCSPPPRSAATCCSRGRPASRRR